MAAKFLNGLLTELEQCRFQFGRKQSAHVIKLLAALSARDFPDAASLIRFHEALLFLRAFPHGPSVLRRSENLLRSFCKRVDRLRQAGADMSEFDPLEVSGIAGTRMADVLSFDVAQWLAKRIPGKVEIDWKEFDEEWAWAAAWPRLMPLLEEDAYVEANIPWRRWLQAAQGSKSASPAWLLRRFASLPVSDREKTELYDSMRVPLRWELANLPLSRTRNYRTVPRVFYHQDRLLRRNEVSLTQELSRRPPALVSVSPARGAAILNMVREVMLVRYRELYGTTLGDPASVRHAEVGRGVSIYLWTLPPERRLPLRAYVAGFTLKNGVPVNYIEAIGLCEWMEVGFNTFYTFRGGEAGWMYAQALRCLCQMMGTTCISVYPYQLGQGNDEAIDSGAFWFYRKLGFRPGRADLQRLAEREEKRISADRGYKTSARTLRRLAQSHVFYELPGTTVGAWDKFSTRNLGLRVNRRMATECGGDSGQIRRNSAQRVARALGVQTSAWRALDRASFENLALPLALIPDLSSWKPKDKQALVRIIRAKARPDEMTYLNLTQRHDRLREALLQLGS